MASNTASLAQTKSSLLLEKHPTNSNPIRHYLRKLQLCLLLVKIGIEVGIDVPYTLCPIRPGTKSISVPHVMKCY